MEQSLDIQQDVMTTDSNAENAVTVLLKQFNLIKNKSNQIVQEQQQSGHLNLMVKNLA